MNYNFDVEKITQQVKEVIHSSQGFNIDYLKVDNIINDWLKAKKFFIEKLNGNLIYESEKVVSFALDQRSKEERLEKFADLIYHHYRNEELGDFLYALHTEDFYNNKTSRSYYCNSTLTIPENYKVVKSFKFFVEDKKLLKDIQNEASRIIQENIVSGHLCLSVHPLDFLSASENVHNWRSCYALDGEYRVGCLNYLMDSTTVMCYLKAEEDAILPHFPKDLPWNSKKWRVWLFFSNDRSMFMTGRQYPFTNNGSLDYIKENIFPEIGFGTWSNIYTEKLNGITDERTGHYFGVDSSLYPIARTLKPISQIVVDGYNVHGYNDILRSHAYLPAYAFQTGANLWESDTGYTNDKTIIKVGRECRCPICDSGSINHSDILACQSCVEKYELSAEPDDYYYCDICGVSAPDSEMYYLDLSQEKVCRSCWEKEVITCQLCGLDDLPHIITYYNGMYLCPGCIERRKNLNWFSEEEN